MLESDSNGMYSGFTCRYWCNTGNLPPVGSSNESCDCMRSSGYCSNCPIINENNNGNQLSIGLVQNLKRTQQKSKPKQQKVYCYFEGEDSDGEDYQTNNFR